MFGLHVLLEVEVDSLVFKQLIIFFNYQIASQDLLAFFSVEALFPTSYNRGFWAEMYPYHKITPWGLWIFEKGTIDIEVLAFKAYYQKVHRIDKETFVGQFNQRTRRLLDPFFQSVAYLHHTFDFESSVLLVCCYLKQGGGVVAIQRL